MNPGNARDSLSVRVPARSIGRFHVHDVFNLSGGINAVLAHERGQNPFVLCMGEQEWNFVHLEVGVPDDGAILRCSESVMLVGLHLPILGLLDFFKEDLGRARKRNLRRRRRQCRRRQAALANSIQATSWLGS